MGATLAYAKVVDRERLFSLGGEIRPGLDNVVLVAEDGPARARPFNVMRLWTAFEGAFTETWRIQDPHGRTLREGVPREITAQSNEIADEIDDLEVEFADEGYQLVLEVDGREVGRVGFPVKVHAADGEAP